MKQKEKSSWGKTKMRRRNEDHHKFNQIACWLGSLIIQLMAYVSPRNNVHHAIKNQVQPIRASYNKMREELGKVAQLFPQKRRWKKQPKLSRPDLKRKRRSQKINQA